MCVMCRPPSAELSPGPPARTPVRALHILTDAGPFSGLCFIQKRKEFFSGSDILCIFEEHNARVAQGQPRHVWQSFHGRCSPLPETDLSEPGSEGRLALRGIRPGSGLGGIFVTRLPLRFHVGGDGLTVHS